MPSCTAFGISDRFQSLFLSEWYVTHVLLTLPPLIRIAPDPFDLHASSTPSAFNLNQDQILNEKTREFELIILYLNLYDNLMPHKHRWLVLSLYLSRTV